jgi:peptidoglycan/xylan/chitin deacetylase (PgdA/CDA1 family)
VANGISTAPSADTLDRALRLERERGVTASYFFTVYPDGNSSRYDCVYDFGDVCTFRGERTRIRDVVRTIHDDGFEVGLHGSYNSALIPGLLAREKRALEAATQLPVATTRQHFLHWRVDTTPGLQAAAGLRADSSIGFNRNLGFRSGTSLPFRWFDLARDRPVDLLELPIVVQDGTLLRSDGLELDVELAWEVTRRLVDTVAEVGGVATFVVHPNNLERDEYEELFVRALDHCAGRDAWFASLRDLDAWWRERERRLGL